MPQILPIRELKNTAEISEKCHASSEPIFITKNGYGDMVIMSMETFEETQQKLDLYKSIEVSEQQIKEGNVKDARASLASLRENYSSKLK